MGIPAASFTTYDAKGNREDLTDIIANIAPVETWFQSTIASVEANATLHEWQTDTLAAAAANAQIEGDTVAATATVATARVGNYCQIIRKAFAITDTQEQVKKAGRVSETSYQTETHLKELANDIEYAFIINTATAAGATGTARQLKGALGWITTNLTSGTGTANEALTETLYNDNLALLWAVGGKPSNSICGSVLRRKISAFSGNNTRFVAMTNSDVLNATYDMYKSDFGQIAIHLHFIMQAGAATSVINFGEMKLWRKAWLRHAKRELMARTAPSSVYNIECEVTLECGQEKGSGKIIEAI